MIHLVVENEAGHDWWIGVTGSQLKQLRQVNCLKKRCGRPEHLDLTTTDEDLPCSPPN
jgi:hypothetical protein